MSDEITKTELLTMLEVQSKTAQQMEKIANALNTLAEEQKSLTKALTNGVPDRIVEGVCDKQKATFEIIKRMSEDITWLKIIWGSAGVLIAIVTVVLHFLGHKG